MGSSATERGSLSRLPVPERVGAYFQLLMQVRMLIAPITLSLIPADEVTVVAVLLVLAVVGLSWLAGRQWRLIAPWVAGHPLLFGLDMCLSFAVLAIGGTGGPFFLCTVVTAAVAGLLYRWQGMLLVAGLQMVSYGAVLGLDTSTVETAAFQNVIGQPLFYPLVGFAGVALRRILDESEGRDEARRRAEVLAAAADERARLAREMHDSLAKTLRGIALAAAALPTWISRDPARAAAEAGRISAATEIASREARSLLRQLRDDTVTRPLPAAVLDTARVFEAEQGIEVSCVCDERADLPMRARYEAVAILAEALTNVERHAHAGSVEVVLAMDDDHEGVVLTVRDDGRGFQSEDVVGFARAGRYGLAGLHERAERVGGTLTIDSTFGAGTVVIARLPLEQVQAPTRVPLTEVG